MGPKKKTDEKLPKLAYFVEKTNSGEVIDKNWWHSGTNLLYTCALEPMRSNFDNFPSIKRTTNRDLLITRNATPYVHLPEVGSIYSNVVQRITLKKGINRKFMQYALIAKSSELRGYGVSIESISYEKWANLKLWVPSEEEQHNIVISLDARLVKLDTLLSLIDAQIERLLQYRSAVIKEAVSKN